MESTSVILWIFETGVAVDKSCCLKKKKRET
jgi:hypothetical protein